MTLTVSVMNPFVYICFTTLASVCLGLLLLVNGFNFAGAVLIIVNAGAIAMVFLFVCMLSARNEVIHRRSDFLKISFFFLVTCLLGGFCAYNYNMLEESFNLISQSSDVAAHITSSLKMQNNSFVFESSLPDDFSLISHILILEENNSFFGFLPIIGVMLVIVMVVAILVTQRTKTTGLKNAQMTALSIWPRRWTWDRGTICSPGLEPRTKFNFFKWH